MTESPRRNIFEMNLSLLIGLPLPFGVSVHICESTRSKRHRVYVPPLHSPRPYYSACQRLCIAQVACGCCDSLSISECGSAPTAAKQTKVHLQTRILQADEAHHPSGLLLVLKQVH